MKACEPQSQPLSECERIALYFREKIGCCELDYYTAPLYALDLEHKRHRDFFNQNPESAQTRGFKARIFFALKNLLAWTARSGNSAGIAEVRETLPHILVLSLEPLIDI